MNQEKDCTSFIFKILQFVWELVKSCLLYYSDLAFDINLMIKYLRTGHTEDFTLTLGFILAPILLFPMVYRVAFNSYYPKNFFKLLNSRLSSNSSTLIKKSRRKKYLPFNENVFHSLKDVFYAILSVIVLYLSCLFYHVFYLVISTIR